MSTNALKVDSKVTIRRRIVVKQAEMFLKRLIRTEEEPINLLRDLMEYAFLRRIQFIQEQPPSKQIAGPKKINSAAMKRLVMGIRPETKEQRAKKEAIA